MKDKIHVKDQFCAGPNCDCRPTHTPTPWGLDETRKDGTTSIISRFTTVIVDVFPNDATFIVRAVNSHEELIGMLKAALNNLDDQSGGYLTRDIEQAVAKAEWGL